MDAANLIEPEPEPIEESEEECSNERSHFHSELSGVDWLAALMFLVSLGFLLCFPVTGALSSVEKNLEGAPNNAWFPMFWLACGLTTVNFVVFFLQRRSGRVAMLISIGLTVIPLALLLDWWSRYHQFADAIRPS